MLSQPIDRALAGARRVLIAGCGGGYDVFTGIPIALALQSSGCEVILANLSFAYLDGLDGAERQPTIPNLFRVPPAAATERAYCPEAWLARWFADEVGRPVDVWAFDKTGVEPLRRAYVHLVEAHAIDAIVVVDGGVDALLRGDESALGTPAEDLATLAAIRGLPVATKILAGVALGAEVRDGICHAQVFERFGELSRRGALLGSASWTLQEPAVAGYCAAIDYVFHRQREQRQSHINRVLCAAIRGEAGARGPHVWISPLLAVQWFFAFDEVAASHLFLDALAGTTTIWEVSARIEAIRKGMTIRDRSAMPI